MRVAEHSGHDTRCWAWRGARLLVVALILTGCAGGLDRPAGLGAPVTPEAAGLSWRECLVPASEEAGWMGADACLGGPAPVLDEAERGQMGRPTERGHELLIGANVYESSEVPLPVGMWDLYVLSKNGRPQSVLAGEFTAYSPDHALQAIGGRPVWEFAAPGRQTVIYAGVDLREQYGVEAAYAPYEVGGKLLLVAQQAGKFFIVYDGRRVGSEYDNILIAYCCEPAAYSARGGGGRYRFWARRGTERYVAEIAAAEQGTLRPSALIAPAGIIASQLDTTQAVW